MTASVPFATRTPRQLAAWFAPCFQPYVDQPLQLEFLCWEDAPRGPRPAPTVRAGHLVAVTAAGFVLEVAGRGGPYRWFCGWVDLWTGHVVIRTPALAKAVRARLKGRKAAGAPEGTAAEVPEGVAAGGGH